jgi:CO/xanthine dehydrogenase FAD-binding subunit
MTLIASSVRTRVFLAAVVVFFAVGATAATGARNDSTPVGPLPAGPTTTTTTKRGLLVAVALPRAARKSGLVWRLARRYDSHIVRQISEADVAGSVVLVFKVVGRGNTSLVFALTRGDASPKALKAVTHKIRSM